MSHHGALLDIARIRNRFSQERIGRRIAYYKSTGSTNDVAWSAVEGGDADGLVVLAEHQSSGRGRLGRAWEMPNAAGVLMSVVVCDTNSGRSAPTLGLISAVAVCDSIAKSASVAATIKWPNDILVNGRKMAGILIETRTSSDDLRASVVGIGINCLQHRAHFAGTLAETATSLETESKSAVDRSDVVIRLLGELNHWLGRSPLPSHESLRNAWRSRSAMLGERIRVRCNGVTYSGFVMDIDPTSALLIKLDEGGVRSFAAADTTVIRVKTDDE